MKYPFTLVTAEVCICKIGIFRPDCPHTNPQEIANKLYEEKMKQMIHLEGETKIELPNY